LKNLSVLILAVLVLSLFSQVYIQTVKSALSPIDLTTSCPDNVTVYFLDLGQGDSILVKTPSKNILIDGGPIDAGSKVLSDLNAYHVTKIDLMVATHPHADHIGGLISVLQSSMPVQDIVYNGYNYTSTQTFNTWKSLALTHNLTQGSRNQVYAMSPTINFTVISPINPTQFGSTTDVINDNSIVMKLQIGNTSVLLTGDAQYDSEQIMLSSGYNLHSQLLKVGHHGSSTSTSQAFLNAVNPTYAVISAGINNTYGHPEQQTLDILANNNIISYGTYNYGTITFSLNSVTSSPTPTLSSSPSSSPTLPASPSPTAKLSPTVNPSPSPTIPEITPIIGVIFFLALIPLVIAKFRERNPGKFLA
jgi:competence protein ComEC